MGICVSHPAALAPVPVPDLVPGPNLYLTTPAPNLSFTAPSLNSYLPAPALNLCFPAVRFTVKACYTYSVYLYNLGVYLYELTS